MDPVCKTTSNLNLVADGCVDLPATVHMEGDDVAISTYWAPTAEERDAIGKGHQVRLTLLTEHHPRVRLDVPSLTQP